jgi:hypothetical protein
MADQDISDSDRLDRIAKELKSIREMMTKVINYMVDAESEIPEKMRRFIMYMHDVHDIINLYHEGGQQVPRHVHAEMERCDDRYRQLLEEMHTDGGTFEKVRRDMAKDPENKWDHTRQLAKPKEKPNETGSSNA